MMHFVTGSMRNQRVRFGGASATPALSRHVALTGVHCVENLRYFSTFLFGCMFERIVANRLLRFGNVSPNDTAHRATQHVDAIPQAGQGGEVHLGSSSMASVIRRRRRSNQFARVDARNHFHGRGNADLSDIQPE